MANIEDIVKSMKVAEQQIEKKLKDMESEVAKTYSVYETVFANASVNNGEKTLSLGKFITHGISGVKFHYVSKDSNYYFVYKQNGEPAGMKNYVDGQLNTDKDKMAYFSALISIKKQMEDKIKEKEKGLADLNESLK